MPDLLKVEGLRAGYGEAVVLPKLSLDMFPPVNIMFIGE